MNGFLCDLIAHSEWANAVFFNAWADSPCRDLEEMRKRAGHIVGVQHGFLSILRGENLTSCSADQPPDRNAETIASRICFVSVRIQILRIPAA